MPSLPQHSLHAAKSLDADCGSTGQEFPDLRHKELHAYE